MSLRVPSEGKEPRTVESSLQIPISHSAPIAHAMSSPLSSSSWPEPLGGWGRPHHRLARQSWWSKKEDAVYELHMARDERRGLRSRGMMADVIYGRLKPPGRRTDNCAGSPGAATSEIRNGKAAASGSVALERLIIE